MKIVGTYTFTFLCVLTGIAIICLNYFWDYDIIQLQISFLDRIEKNDLDDLFVGIGLIFIGVIIDRVRAENRRIKEVANSEAKLVALRATMTTVQDIVNNFLNNVQYFRMEAEGKIPDELLEEMDQAITETASKIKALGSLKSFVESPMSSGTGVHYTVDKPL